MAKRITENFVFLFQSTDISFHDFLLAIVAYNFLLTTATTRKVSLIILS